MNPVQFKRKKLNIKFDGSALLHGPLEREHRKRYLGDVLSYAIDSGNVEIAKELIAKGADVKHITGENGHSIAFGAIKNKEKDILKMLLAEGVDVETRGPSDLGNGESLLCRAVAECSIDIVRILIACNADVNKTANMQVDNIHVNNMTPLHVASFCEDAAICELLISKGATVNVFDYYSRSPLFYAFRNGAVDIARVLIAHGATVRTPSLLQEAIDANNTELKVLLYENGYPLQVYGHFIDPTQIGQIMERQVDTIFFTFLEELHLLFLKVPCLLNPENAYTEFFNAASIDVHDMKAAPANQPFVIVYDYVAFKPEVIDKCMVYMLENASKSEIQRFFAGQAWMFVAKNRFRRLAECLKSKGIPYPNKPDIHINAKPIHIACENGDEGMIESMLNAGADIADVDEPWKTHFVLNCKKGNNHGNSQQKDEPSSRGRGRKRKGKRAKRKSDTSDSDTCWRPPLMEQSPIHRAAAQGLLVEVQRLVGKIPDQRLINSRDEICDTPLHLACVSGNPKLVYFLIEGGAIIDIPNKEGETPLCYALQKYCDVKASLGDFQTLHIMAILLDHGASRIFIGPYSRSKEVSLDNQRMLINKLYKKSLFAFITFMQLSSGVIDLVVDVSEMIRRNDLVTVQLIRQCGHKIFLTLAMLYDPQYEETAEKCRILQKSLVHLNILSLLQTRKNMRREKGSLLQISETFGLPPGLQALVLFPNRFHVCNMEPIMNLLYDLCNISAMKTNHKPTVEEMEVA